MEQLGILMITAQGGRRFRHHRDAVGDGHLLEGTVELLAEAGPTPLPQERERLLPAPAHRRRPRAGTHPGAASLRRRRMGGLPDY
jgi:Lon protease-like protein